MNSIKDFPIQTGKHCATTALSEIMKFNGYNLSEPMILGISNALNFIYLNPFHEQYSRLVFTRSPMLEYDFFKNIGMNFKWHKDSPLDYQKITEYIDKNIPILALTDPSKLDFFDVSIPSAASHTLTIIGYDTTDRSLKISDMIGNQVFSCDYESFCEAMKIKKTPFYVSNIWGVVENIDISQSMEELILKGMKSNAFKMLQPATHHSGIAAIVKLREELSMWAYLNNYRFLCAHVYSSIEKIGTGGSGFRNLYIKFLKEASMITSEMDMTGLINKKIHVASLYKDISKYFYLESRDNGKSYIPQIQQLLSNLIEEEHKFWEEVSNSI
ncbi:BtrH N-terminal domain-containing protein [Metasolibacillus meyeri]|uniref:BtrH N-terminal domain-containing protein n=1 Tax=Metasolibacillus meyeri TaxID=1071052 RepID=UPI00187D1D1E|nr:BtrH N-terminal domain-containing protein [Metasolibacillus meyeri]